MLYSLAGRIAGSSGVNITPNAKAIPGSNKVSEVINGMAGWGLLLAGAAIVISAVIWAFGANSQNSQQATAGKRGVLIALAAAVIIGGGTKLIDWAFSLGGGIS